MHYGTEIKLNFTGLFVLTSMRSSAIIDTRSKPVLSRTKY